MKNKQSVIVGGIPRPIGGVTNFVLRLILSVPERFSVLLDLYPSTKKVEIPIRRIQFLNGSIDLLRFLNRESCHTVLFNFSRAHSLLLLCILPKGHANWGLILHNGELRLGSCLKIIAPVVRRALKKIDSIGVLSKRQFDFYSNMGVRDEKMFRIKPYLPCRKPNPNGLNRLVPKEILNWIEDGKRVFVISGYPTSIYQHLEVIQLFDKLYSDGHHDLRLAAFLYGPDTDGILNTIKSKLASVSFGKLYWGIDEEVFTASLSLASGYLRMNTVDSFGIAVADAISMGVPAIASDVCERFSGAISIDAYDFDKLASFILNSAPSGDKYCATDGIDEQLIDFLNSFSRN